MTTPKKWIGTWPSDCDLCHIKLTTYNYFIDGVVGGGHWALMCPKCHDKFGQGLGTGLGQKYDSKTLEKIGD